LASIWTNKVSQREEVREEKQKMRSSYVPQIRLGLCKNFPVMRESSAALNGFDADGYIADPGSGFGISEAWFLV
jgi:hypothetical protein